MDNIKLEAITRDDNYSKFLISGGDFNSLPEPITRRDKILYAACVSGFGLPQRAAGFYRCLLNSQANEQNFCTGILDLGDKRVTTAKARFRFILRSGVGATLPTAIGIRLFANNSAGRDSIAGYTIRNDNVITSNIVADKEYIIEGTFTPNSVPLNECRYLKPFLTLTKGSTNLSIKHLIDLYEISIEVDGKIYDVTDTVTDFAPQVGSDISYIENSISEQGLIIRKAPWFGKRVACLGDSITFGMRSGQNSTTTKEDNPWVNQLKNYCGFTDIKNYGLSGNRVSGGTTPMSERFSSMLGNEDIAIIMGGTNDLSNNVPIGTFDSAGAIATTDTFYGALNVLFKGLKQKYQNKPIVIITPLNAVNQNIPNGISTGLKLTMEDYRVAIRNVAKLYGFYILELQNLVGFDSMIEADRQKFITDGVHPNQAGHDIMAKVIGQYINSLA